MRWFWLFVIFTTVWSLLQSDETKRDEWRRRAEREWSPTADRVASLLMMALAIWQSFVIWGGR